jgi:hypothetical protein
MRFMVILKASKNTEAGTPPTKELVTAMGKFNEEMVKAGVLLAGEGLLPSAKAARITFSGSKRSVTPGPFAPEGSISGFWVLQVKSQEEAIEWASRAPFNTDEVLEVRHIAEASDFPEDVLTPELAAREQELREAVQRRAAR